MRARQAAGGAGGQPWQQQRQAPHSRQSATRPGKPPPTHPPVSGSAVCSTKAYCAGATACSSTAMNRSAGGGGKKGSEDEGSSERAPRGDQGSAGKRAPSTARMAGPQTPARQQPPRRPRRAPPAAHRRRARPARGGSARRGRSTCWPRPAVAVMRESKEGRMAGQAAAAEPRLTRLANATPILLAGGSSGRGRRRTWQMAPQAASQPALPSAQSAGEAMRPASAAAPASSAARPGGGASSAPMSDRSAPSAGGTCAPPLALACGRGRMDDGTAESVGTRPGRAKHAAPAGKSGAASGRARQRHTARAHRRRLLCRHARGQAAVHVRGQHPLKGAKRQGDGGRGLDAAPERLGWVEARDAGCEACEGGAGREPGPQSLRGRCRRPQAGTPSTAVRMGSPPCPVLPTWHAPQRAPAPPRTRQAAWSAGPPGWRSCRPPARARTRARAAPRRRRRRPPPRAAAPAACAAARRRRRWRRWSRWQEPPRPPPARYQWGSPRR